MVQESKNLANEFTEEVGGQSPSLAPQLTLQLDVKVRWGPCLAVSHTQQTDLELSHLCNQSQTFYQIAKTGVKLVENYCQQMLK